MSAQIEASISELKSLQVAMADSAAELYHAVITTQSLSGPHSEVHPRRGEHINFRKVDEPLIFGPSRRGSQIAEYQSNLKPLRI